MVTSSALGSLGARAAAQTPAQECVRGTPTIVKYAPADTAQETRLLALLWSTSHDEYARLVADAGPLAAFDTIATRASALLAATGAAERRASERALLVRRLAELRAGLASPENSGRLPRHVPDYADLAPVTGLRPGTVGWLFDGDDRTALAFDSTGLAGAIALCATARTVHRYLDFLADDSLQAVADRYAAAARRWDLYIDHGYSMTFLERWGNSCRFGWQVIATAAYQRCRKSTVFPLGPPAVRTIFLHPSAGLTAFRNDSTNFPPVTLVEWYGIVGHRFSASRIDSYGASFASFYPERGRPHLGVLLHTPLGRVGAFDLRNFAPRRRPSIVYAFDVNGWIPGVQASARRLAARWLSPERLAAQIIPIAAATRP